MSKFLRLIRLERKRIGLREEPGPFLQRLSFQTFNISLIILVLIFVLGFFYLWQINRVSTGGYQIKDLSKKIENLQQENKKLEIEAMGLQSMESIARSGEELKMVAPDKVEYLLPIGPVAALSE